MKHHGVTDFFKRLLGAEEAKTGEYEQASSAGEDAAALPGGHETPSVVGEGVLPGQEEPSPAMAPGGPARKIAQLRRALEFENELADKLPDIHTARNMLLFMHQYLLLKFENLHSVGIIGEKSYSVLDRITQKSQSLLAGEGQPAGAVDPEMLAQENESLKRQLKVLYAKHVKSDIISEKELVLEEEKAKLLARLEDMKQRYDHAQKRIENLEAENKNLDRVQTQYKLLGAKFRSLEKGAKEVERTANALQELESQNRFLKGKVEHQERLIHAMTWDDSKHKELVETIGELDEQKKALKAKLEGQTRSAILDAALQSLAEGDERKAGLESLFRENRTLYAELENKDEDLETAAPFAQGENLLSSMEDLREDTFRLNELAKAKEEFTTLAQGKEGKIRDMEAMLKALSTENQLLKQALEAKKSKIESLDADPAKQKMLETIASLRKENSRAQLAIENLHHVVTTVSHRNEEVEKKFVGMKNLYRENQFLKQESERKNNLIAELKKKVVELRDLKKNYYQLQAENSKLQKEFLKTTAENVNLEMKVKKVRAEYEGMISEYNKLFENE